MRKLRPESRRWIAPKAQAGLFRRPLDPSVPFVPFVPLPDPNSAWAILCPAGCTTELIILPEHAGQWVECPTCGFRFLGPHPAQPKMVAEARAKAAREAAGEKSMAGVLAALAKSEPESRSSAAKPDGRKLETPPAKTAAKPTVKSPGPAEAEELSFAELVPEQVQVMDVLKMLAEANREATEPPQRPAPPTEACPGELTPEESVAIDALEALAEATLPARKAPAPAASAGHAVTAEPAMPKKSPSRAAQRLALGVSPQRRKIQVAKGTGRAVARMPVQPVSPEAARASYGDLVPTWAVSLGIAAAIVGTTVACGLYDLALLGGIVFVGLPVIRTVVVLKRRRDDGWPG
jgi:hypothetical protein